MADLQMIRDAFVVACRAAADAFKKALAWAGRQLIRLGEFLLVTARAEEATLLRRIERLRLAAIQDPATLDPEELLRPGERLHLNISAEDQVGSVAERLRATLAEARAAVAKARADEARAKLDVLLSADGHCPHRPEWPCVNPMCGHQGCARRHAETRAATYVLKGSAAGKSEADAFTRAAAIADEVDPYPHLFPGECDPIELAAPLREVVFPASRWSAEIERLVDEAHASASAPQEPQPPENQCPSHPEEPCKFPRTCQARGRCMLAPKDVP